MSTEIKIAVIGLGYVGLPLALAFAEEFSGTVGFDINTHKIEEIASGRDPTSEGHEAKIRGTSLKVSSDPAILREKNFFVVGVPTPVDNNHNPDLGPLLKACEIVGKVLVGGETVVFESTVFPGVPEEICGPALEAISGLVCGRDFTLGYSPERINPGDKEHTLERVIKVVSGQDRDTLDRVAAVYNRVVKAGVHRAPSIKVAEAAKVIENTQRDLNIALMNELAIIFDRMGISTKDVLDAAGSKWNFLRFTPGLVGGHCIGVDPYYLTTKAEQLGYHPEVILAGRRINDGMGRFIAQRAVKLMITRGLQPHGARVGVLGLTFKENVSDIRNSRVPDIIGELCEFGVEPIIYDPCVKDVDVKEEYGLTLSPLSALRDLDAVILAVAHNQFLEMGTEVLCSFLRRGGVFIDVKSLIDPREIPNSITYWSL